MGGSNEEARAAGAREAEIAAAAVEGDEATRAWATIEAALARRFGEPTWDLWFSGIVVGGAVDDTLVLVGPDHLLSWLRRRYLPRMGQLARELTDFRSVLICAERRSDKEVT